MSSTTNPHPCQKCGACCAIYRVSFLRSELAPEGLWKVPLDVIEDSGGETVSLKGTTKTHRPSCSNLKGKIGHNVGCSIYQNRPSPCRNFKASYENGYQQQRCDEARKSHGLKPLTKFDWQIFFKQAE